MEKLVLINAETNEEFKVIVNLTDAEYETVRK